MTTSQSLISKTSSSRAKSSNASVTPKVVKSSASSVAKHLTARPPKRSSSSASPAGSSSLPSTSVEHQCAHCGSAALQLKHVTRSFGKGAALLVIEAIPLWSCQNCGESYFSAHSLHEIERIKALRKAVAVNRSVAVAAFEAVAA
jgi:YgiT-type zinc finger domain-containing protein